MKLFDGYDEKYPNLIMDIIEYFWIRNGIEPQSKSVFNFCLKDGKFKYNPDVIIKICDKLCDNNCMTRSQRDSYFGAGNSYINMIPDSDLWKNSRKKLFIYYNSIIYGFEYIYRLYKQIVIPVVQESDNGDYSIGTGFMLFNGIVTAKHCIENAKSISIRGYSKQELKSTAIYISKNPAIDIAFIDVNRQENIDVFTGEGTIMQEVLAMGYPKIPAFTNFLTAELATISSIAERMTPTKGTIAAYGENIFAKMELMLITAKIRGGNSGGPIINGNGSIVGIACQIPFYEGDYDDLGYGIAVPIKYLNQLINMKESTFQYNENYFTDFIG